MKEINKRLLLTAVSRNCGAWDLSEFISDFFLSFNSTLVFKIFGIFVNESVENPQLREAATR